jgi:hypothetical protein
MARQWHEQQRTPWHSLPTVYVGISVLPVLHDLIAKSAEHSKVSIIKVKRAAEFEYHGQGDASSRALY